MTLTYAAAQGLTDGLAALALGARVLTAARRGPPSPLHARLIVTFSGMCVFFACRAVAHLSGDPNLTLAARLVACLLLPMGLILVEGAMRRHAPVVLKVGVTLGASALALALLAFGVDWAWWSILMGSYVTLSLLAGTILLLTRDRASLSHQENASIDALMMATAGLMLLGLTDFLDESPLGMSGLGAALLVFFVLANPHSNHGIRRALVELLFVTAIAGVFTAGLAYGLALAQPADLLRLGVASLVFGIALTTVLAGVRGQPGQGTQALRAALAASDTSSLTAFLDHLKGQPLLRGLRLAEAGLLADYDPELLGASLGARPVWTRRDLGDPTSQNPTGGYDELNDLLARTEASHAALISRDPLRIALLTLPDMGVADGGEIDFALFCKLAAVAAKGSA
jgi:hypothetical protein